MDKLQAMAVFLQIAEKGSLTGAAESLGKSLPTVVRILSALEESLQVRLFNRTTRRISLTEEGILYRERCQRILGEIEETELALSRTQTEPSGSITVTAPVRFGEMHVAPAVAEFLRLYPRTNIKLLLLDRVVNLVDEGVDVAVRIAPLEDSTLIAKPIGHIRHVVCTSPDVIKKFGQPDHPDELSNLPCVSFTGISTGKSWRFKDGNKNLQVPIKSQFSCNQVNPSIKACISGLGFGQFLCYQVMPAVQRGDLQFVLEKYETDKTPLNLVFQQNRLLSARIRTFVDWITPKLTESLNQQVL